MAKAASFCPFLLSLLIICCSGFLLSYSYYIYALSVSTPGEAISLLKQNKISIFQNGIMNKIYKRRTLGDTTIITVPSTKPVSVNPTNPAATPTTVPSTTIAPPYSPAPAVAYPPPSSSAYPPPSSSSYPPPPPSSSAYPPPSSSSSPPSVPITNPQAQPPPSNANNGAPSGAGQKWCVAKSGVSQTVLQSALDYACGQGGVDCSQIQQGGRCYDPNTLQNHASYAFNTYYQKNPAPTSCDFGGTATLVNTNPSSGSCIYSSSSAASSTPTLSSPATTPTPPSTSTSPTPSSSTSSTPTPSSSTSTSPTSSTSTSSTPTSSPTPKSSGAGVFGFGSPPSVLNSSSGNTAGFGSPIPPTGSDTSWSHSDVLRPYAGSTLLLMSLVTAKLCIRP